MSPAPGQSDRDIKAEARADPRHAILYDSDCGFCKWSLNKILGWDRRGRLRPVAIQSEEGQALLATVPASERLDSWHLASPSGELRSAGAAAEPLMEFLPGGRPLGLAFRTFPKLTNRAYRFVACNRDRIARVLRIDEGCEIDR